MLNNNEATRKMFNKKHKISSAYSILIAILPVLSIYYSGIPGTNVADVCLMGFWVLTIVMAMIGYIDFRSLKRSFTLCHWLSLTFVCYCIALALVALVVNDPQLIDILVRTTRIVFYLCTVVVLSSLLLNIDTLIKAIQIVSLLASVFLIFQVIVYRTTGNIIRGFVSFVPVYIKDYVELDYASYYAHEYQRPTSFFLEPAHFSRYALFGLASYLFGHRQSTLMLAKIAAAMLITIGIIFSTSGIGIVYASVVWLVFIGRVAFSEAKNGNILRVIIPIFVLLMAIISLYMLSPTIQFAISRTTRMGSSSAFAARLGSMRKLLEYNSIAELVFGHGYGAVPAVGTWMTDLTYVVYGTGILGFGILFVTMAISFCRSNRRISKRMAVILVALLMIADDSFNSVVVVLLYSLLLFDHDQAKDLKPADVL